MGWECQGIKATNQQAKCQLVHHWPQLVGDADEDEDEDHDEDHDEDRDEDEDEDDDYAHVMG